MKLSPSRIKLILVTSVAVVSLFMLIFLYGVTYKQINSSIRTSNRLMHANEIELELERLISQLKYAETTQRGFLITRDSSFLLPFQKSRSKISSSFSSLKELLSGDHVQLNQLTLLEKLVNERYQLLHDNMQIARNERLEFIKLISKLEQGSKLMEAAIDLVAKMLLYQDNKLRSLQKQHHDAIVTTPLIYFTIVLITIAVFTFLLLKMNSNRKKVLKVNDELRIINESFFQAEKLAALGNWRLNVQDNSTSFSDNFYVIMGLEPSELKMTIRNFLIFVHPEDRHSVLMAFRKVFTDYSSFSLIYRIYSKDKKLKYIRTIGKIISENNNPKFLIGINMDISESVLNARQLELKNKKLELFNADLASFNYAASHDLQAPLRKIQMFISRIRETDEQNLSKQGTEYFDRIHNSALQMQVLINDLLMFSRTNAGNKKFESTDLNQLLENALDDLTAMLEEKSARITADRLPTMHVIPYQIQQLFINLISNSLKFSKPDILPVITINCQIVSKDELTKSFDIENPSAEYYKLSFIDNGIGFEKEYADRIFHLLFRLHDRITYPGSGIGLAICKKIVENHFGYIKARSMPGEGATFTIYLPTNLSKVHRQ